MKKLCFLVLFVFQLSFAQVGINTTTPNAQLEIKSSNQATPSNTDGFLAPKVDAFPATNPTAAQQGMMVYLTTTSGANAPGYYYWDNLTTTWIGMANTPNVWKTTGNAGTSAGVNFIGTTDNVDLMFRRNNVNSGRISANNVHFGVSCGPVSAGTSNAFFGSFSGLNNNSGSSNTFIGTTAGSNNVSGFKNTALGQNSNFGVTGLTNATAIGSDAIVAASNSMVMGSIQGFNGATASCSVAIGTPTPTAAFEVSSVSRGVLIPRVSLTSAAVQAPIVNPQGGALPESTLVYNTATAGLSPNNVYPGFYYWDSTRWVRFDVNGENNPKYYTAVGTTNINSVTSFGPMSQMSLTFTPKDDVVLVNFSAAGRRSDDACQNTAIFFQILLNGVPVTGWQTASKQGIVDIPFATDDVTIWDTNFTYPVAVTIGLSQTISIEWAAPNCSMLNSPTLPLTAFGSVFKSYRSLTVIDPNGGGGIVGSPPVTTNQWALNGNSSTSSLTNFVGTSDAQPLVLKSNNIEGLRINTIGNVGIGITAPADKLHVVGNIRMVDGNQAAGKVLTSDANGTGTWQTPAATDWSLTGNAGTNPSVNFIGTTDNVDFFFRRNNIFAGRLGDTNTFFGKNTGLVNTATSNTFIGERAGTANVTGFDNTFVGRHAGADGASGNDNTYLGYAAGMNGTGNNNCVIGAFAAQNLSGTLNVAVGMSAGATITTGSRNTFLGENADASAANLTNATAIGSKAQVSVSNGLVLGSINGVNGSLVSTNVGIGTTSPSRSLHVATGTSGATPNANADMVLESNGATYQQFLTPSTSETGILFGSNLSAIHSAIISNNASTTQGLQFRTGGNTTRMTLTSAGDLGIGTTAPGGQFQLSLDEGRKPGTNTWTITSDERLKNVTGSYEKGLNEILKLQPIRYHYKNVGDKKFEPEILDQEFVGFLAQEVQRIFPEAVGQDADGYLNLNIHSILVASVNALKELNAKNRELEKENQALKNELSDHGKKLEYLLSEIEKIKNR